MSRRNAFSRALTVVSYIVGGGLMIGVTIALVAYGKGYSYDFKDHRFILNGLVILESEPGGGKVFINGIENRHGTPFRSTIEAGSYNFEVTKDGFRSWTKRVDVLPTEVSVLKDILLFPNSITVESSDLGHEVFGLVESPDHKRIAYLSRGSSSGAWLFDASRRTAHKIYSARRGEVLGSLAWAKDNSRILISSAVKGKSNMTVVGTGDNPDPQNLTDLFNQDFRSLQFNPANSNELYWISPQSNLHRLNLEDKTASAILASRVSSFGFGGGRVFYIQSTKLGKTLFSLERSGIKQELIQSLAESPTYEMLFHRLDDVDYLVVVPSRAKTATLYTSIFSKHPEAKVLAKDVDHIKRSPDGRFLVVHNSDAITTYDLKKKRPYDFKNAPKAITSLDWFDEFHLLMVAGGKAIIVEFDSANATTLEPIGVSAFASPDHKAIVGLNPKDPTQMIYQLLR